MSESLTKLCDHFCGLRWGNKDGVSDFPSLFITKHSACHYTPLPNKVVITCETADLSTLIQSSCPQNILWHCTEVFFCPVCSIINFLHRSSMLPRIFHRHRSHMTQAIWLVSTWPVEFKFRAVHWLCTGRRLYCNRKYQQGGEVWWRHHQAGEMIPKT